MTQPPSQIIQEQRNRGSHSRQRETDRDRERERVGGGANLIGGGGCEGNACGRRGGCRHSGRSTTVHHGNFFWRGKSRKQNIKQKEQCSHTNTHTHIHQANKEKEEKEGAQRRIPFNRSSFFLACRAITDPIRAEPAGAGVRSPHWPPF